MLSFTYFELCYTLSALSEFHPKLCSVDFGLKDMPFLKTYASGSNVNNMIVDVASIKGDVQQVDFLMAIQRNDHDHFLVQGRHATYKF